MSVMYDRTISLYRMPDVDVIESDKKLLGLTRRIAGGESDFVKIYSGKRVRKDDFREFYNMIIGKDYCDAREKTFRNIP